jgi:DeoR/GlpR family transcriptional regulator of sugar metabolism
MRFDNPSERRAHVVKLVRESGFCKISELSNLLGVSDMTIRRDICRLAEDGFIQAVHGGARTVLPQIGNVDFRLRIERNRDAKRAVALQACMFLEPDSVVALDAGSTILEFARILPPGMGLTVVTHSMPVMTILSQREDIVLYGLGGILRHDTQSFTGPLTILSLNEFRVNILFLATRAFRDGVIYSVNPFDAEMKRAMINISDKVILLIDSSKVQASAGIRVAQLEDIDAIVVDDKRDVSEQVDVEKTKLIIAPTKNGASQIHEEEDTTLNYSD